MTSGATSVCDFRKLPRPALNRLAAHYGLKPESSLASSSLAVAVSEAFACEAVDEEQVHAGLLCELSVRAWRLMPSPRHRTNACRCC